MTAAASTSETTHKNSFVLFRAIVAVPVIVIPVPVVSVIVSSASAAFLIINLNESLSAQFGIALMMSAAFGNTSDRSDPAGSRIM